MATWPATANELIELQQALGNLTPECWQPPTTLGRVGACFVCFERVQGAGAAGDAGFAGAAVTYRRRLLAGATTSGPAEGPYLPALLALREGRLLEQAVRAPTVVPEVLVVNATGRDHPRRAGLALQLGAVLGLPTVGVTTRPLVAEGDWPADQRGATAPLLLGGEVVGCWARTRPGGQAGGRACRLADRRPGRGPGRVGRDPSRADPRASAPRSHAGPNPAGTQPLNALTHLGMRFPIPDPSVRRSRPRPASGRPAAVGLDCSYSSPSRSRRRARSVAAVIAATASAPGRA
jgi:deoxyribonuclease V